MPSLVLVLYPRTAQNVTWRLSTGKTFPGQDYATFSSAPRWWLLYRQYARCLFLLAERVLTSPNGRHKSRKQDGNVRFGLLGSSQRLRSRCGGGTFPFFNLCQLFSTLPTVVAARPVWLAKFAEPILYIFPIQNPNLIVQANRTHVKYTAKAP